MRSRESVDRRVQEMAQKMFDEVKLVARERGLREKEFKLMVVDALRELPKLMAKHKITEW